MERIHEMLSPQFGFFYSVTEELLRKQTDYQELRIVATPEFGRVMLLDGFTQVAEQKHFQYHELIADVPLLAHPEPCDVLIIGGGDGGVTQHVLRHPSVKRVEQVEIDAAVPRYARQYLPSVSAGAFEDVRVKLHIANGQTFITSASTPRYDVIIMDLTDPIGMAAELYTQGFLRQLKARLRDEHAYVALHTTSPVIDTRLFCVVLQTLKSVFSEVLTFYNYIQMYGTLWSVSVAGQGTALKGLTQQEIARRLTTRRLTQLQLLNAESYFALQVAFPYIQQALTHKLQPARSAADLAPDLAL